MADRKPPWCLYHLFLIVVISGLLVWLVLSMTLMDARISCLEDGRVYSGDFRHQGNESTCEEP